MRLDEHLQISDVWNRALFMHMRWDENLHTSEAWHRALSMRTMRLVFIFFSF